MKVAEPEEPRASAERNPGVAPEAGTQRPAQSESGLSRIRAATRKDRTLRFNNLLHHLTVPLLWEAYDRLKRKAAPGVDGVDWYGYGQNLISNLVDLHERIHPGRYRAQPVKRRWIDKADGGKRPLGMTCLEDKIVQQALVLILQEIYEPEFLGFSYGSRPGRSQHNALDALYMAITVKKVGFVLDMDISLTALSKFRGPFLAARPDDLYR
jgi:RNA-directed DNA polymerase